MILSGYIVGGDRVPASAEQKCETRVFKNFWSTLKIVRQSATTSSFTATQTF